MAYPGNPSGRNTIRPYSPTSSIARPNARTRLWEIEALPNSTLAGLEQAYLDSLNAVDAIIEHKASSRRSGRLTESGISAGALEFVLSSLVPKLKSAKNQIEAAKKEAAAKREKIKLQPLDKNDVVGYLRRQELRTWLLAMPAKDRAEYLTSRVSSLSPDLALAILEAPPEMNVAPNSITGVLRDAALKAQHHAAMDDLGQLERGIEIAAQTLELARDEVRQEAGVLDPHEFNRLASPFEKRSSAPWLRRQVSDGLEKVVVVDLVNGIERPATEAEIATGVYAQSLDDYQAFKGSTLEMAR